MTVKAHFVHFLSPGTFVAEESRKPIASWDIEAAKEMARQVNERYGAIPYGFYFTTRSREESELDSKVTDESPMYYLGGKVETLEEVAVRANPDEKVLLSNMRCNGWNRIIVNTNSWRWTQPLKDNDVVLEFTVKEESSL